MKIKRVNSTRRFDDAVAAHYAAVPWPKVHYCPASPPATVIQSAAPPMSHTLVSIVDDDLSVRRALRRLVELLQFVPLEDSLKISRLTIRNRSRTPRRLSVTAYVEWVLGASRSAAAPFIVTEMDPTTGAMLARNAWNADFGDRVAFADLAGRQTAWTGDRTEFLGLHLAQAFAVEPDVGWHEKVECLLIPQLRLHDSPPTLDQGFTSCHRTLPMLGLLVRCVRQSDHGLPSDFGRSQKAADARELRRRAGGDMFGGDDEHA